MTSLIPDLKRRLRASQGRLLRLKKRLRLRTIRDASTEIMAERVGRLISRLAELRMQLAKTASDRKEINTYLSYSRIEYGEKQVRQHLTELEQVALQEDAA